MAEYTEDCCFNYVRDHCKGDGCPCGCHRARSVMRTKHPSDDAFIDWAGDAADKLCTHTVQAAFRAGWNARETAPNTLIIDTSQAEVFEVVQNAAAAAPSMPLSIRCDCAMTPPTMPTLRMTHLPECALLKWRP